VNEPEVAVDENSPIVKVVSLIFEQGSAPVAGVVIESWALPRPSRRTPGPPLCEIDARRLHVALRDPDWLDEMVRAGRVDDR
jgi:hypothetical protein